MLIEFELRPLDFRVLEAWLDGKQWGLLRVLRIAVAPAACLSFWLGTRYPFPLGITSTAVAQLVALAPVLCVRLVFEIGRRIQRWRYRVTQGMTEGQHSLHFSRAGVHHVSPAGIHRYLWQDFLDLQISAHYLFVRFRDSGSVIIPTEALKRFGPDYEAGFFQELLPLMAQANEVA